MVDDSERFDVTETELGLVVPEHPKTLHVVTEPPKTLIVPKPGEVLKTLANGEHPSEDPVEKAAQQALAETTTDGTKTADELIADAQKPAPTLGERIAEILAKGPKAPTALSTTEPARGR